MENNLEIKIEGFLFWKGEPVAKKELAKTFKTSAEEVNIACQRLHETFKERGVKLIENQDMVEIRVSDEIDTLIKEWSKDILSKELSKASLETLAIILYKGSVTRSEIDYIRGVNSTFILRNLSIRGLVEKYINEEDKRTVLYKPTIDLLSYLGVESTEKLPSFSDLNSILNNKIKQENAVENTEVKEQSDESENK